MQQKLAGWPGQINRRAFNQLWISMPAVLVAVPTVTQNSLHPLSTSSITACHLLEGEITEADAPTIRPNAISIRSAGLHGSPMCPTHTQGTEHR